METLSVDLIIETVIQAYLEEEPDSYANEKTRDEVGRVVRACILVLTGDDHHPEEIKTLLSDLENGYGCWLTSIEEALHRGLNELPEDYKIIAGEIIGAFHMAKAFLFDLEGRNTR